MRVLFFLILLVVLQSCATKKYTEKQQLPNGLQAGTEEIYIVVNNQKKLLQKKKFVFTKNDRIKNSKTFDSLGKLIQETEKRLWLIKESYPNHEPYYCKTRWKTKQRERISCYVKKQYKQNEAIYHYNKDGTVKKIVDNFTTFHTQYFYYTNNELSKIITKDRSDKMVDEVLITCINKDAKGTCLKQLRISSKTNHKKEILFTPTYH